MSVRWLHIFLFALLFGSSAWGEEPLLRGVPEPAIQLLKKDRPELFQGALTYEKLDEIIRALSLTGDYERVAAEADEQGTLRVVANPIRTIEQVLITGNSSFSRSTLEDIIGINAKDRFERKKVLDAGERLKQFYGEHGYFNSVIEVSFLKAADNKLRIEFAIEEKEPCRVSSIEIQTDNANLRSRLERFTNRLLNKPLTSSAIEDLRRQIHGFLQEKRFLKAELMGPDAIYNEEKTRAELVYRINEPYRYEFVTTGNQVLTDAAVYRALRLSTLERGGLDPASEVADRLRQNYLKLGYPNVEVTSRIEERPSEFTRRVRLNIKENSRVRIKEIVISGRFSRPAEYYQSFLRDKSSDLIKRGYYNRQDMEKGYEALVNELRNQGFLRAKVQSARLEYLNGQDLARVYVTLDEGPLTQVQSIQFIGAKSFSPEQLRGALGIATNAPLRISDLEQSLDRLKTFYRESGFIEMRLLNEGEALIDYNDKGTQANLRLEIFEGPKVIIQSILIEGNSFTKAAVIFRTLALSPGQVLTPSVIEDAELRLNRMNIFSRVHLHTLEDNTSVTQRTLVVSVTERTPGLVRLGIGATSERDLTARGFINVSHNNLFGTARAASIRAEVKSHVLQVNYPQHEVALSYLEPFIFGSLTRGRVNLIRSDRIFEFDQTNGLTKIITSNRIDLFLERDLSRHLTLRWKLWSLDGRREHELNGLCLDPAKPLCESIFQAATIGPTLLIDHRDDPFSPTRGSYSDFILDYSSPGLGSSRTIHFYRTEASHTQYTRVFSTRSVWANHIKAGYEENLSKESGSGIPSAYAFYLGGLSTIRGFGGSGKGERIPRGNEFDTTTELIERDSHYFLFKSEMRFPLYGEHGGVIFYDGGLVHISGIVQKRPYRDAVGFGYRYNTPVGPLAIDIGFKVRPSDDDGIREEPFRVHFSFGTF